MDKVLVFVNPASRQGAKCLEKIVTWLQSNQFEILNPDYDPAVDTMSDVIERFRNEAKAAIIGGGDGSVNHALPSLMKTGLPLLLIPLGTANNLARTMSIPPDLEKALALLNDGRVEAIDIGIANPGPNEIPFVNVIGIGMSARVNRFVPSEHKRWLGPLAFVITALRVAARMTPFRVAIEYDGEKHHGHSWQVTVCNGRNYGNGLTVDQNATLQDETLHGLSTEIGKWWHGFGLLPYFRAGKFAQATKVFTFSGSTVKITTRRSKHVDIDGDLKARTPIEIAVRPRALKMIVPPQTQNQVETP